ncbi:1-acyl-sn-glycerol-3-phosphate acyltransferase [Psychroserpens sp. BH13MA-6]
MKILWLYIVRAYIRLGLFFYYKKIKVINAHQIPKEQAIMYLANHQNALMDALLIATKGNRFAYYLTRASVFKNPVVGSFLKSLRMLPVFRIRDGWSNLTKNTSVFSKSSQLLAAQQAITIFPEGSHNLKRTVRPLSKGFTRIIFETLEQYPETKIGLIPVGMNYQNAKTYGDSVSINFGQVFFVERKDIGNKHHDLLALKTKVFNELCKLTVHIDTQDYDAILEKIEALDVDFTNPVAVNKCLANELQLCPKQTRNSSLRVLKHVFKILLIINLFVPYMLWKIMIKPRIMEEEFIATFRFAVALTLVPIFMAVVMGILLFLCHWQLAMIYGTMVLLLALLSVKL